MRKISIIILIAFCCISLNINDSHAIKSMMAKGSDCSFYTKNDNFLLAMSWQEGFCASQGKYKPECKALKDGRLKLNGFILHGLWPSSKRCNTSFCEVKKMRNFCDYSPLNLNENVSNELKKIMPSYKYGSCLERHEWNKHGSCSLFDENQYFDLASSLVEEFNNSEFNKFIIENKGKSIELNEMRTKFVEVFHVKNPNDIGFRCSRDGKNTLVEIWMPLPAKVKKGDSLYDLIPKIDDTVSTTCSKSKPINIVA
ncbi:MAG: hypothetical protein OEY79_02860 [Anaplasmataceae bacterium]|nr:hypothetical protein [Anaplasmataceae bacterium]